jgi:hypothetical protein
LIRNAGQFAVERYERKDKRVQEIVQLLENEVMRTVAAAQPKVTARKSIAGSLSHVDNSPGRSHSVHGDAGVALSQTPQGFGHSTYGSLSADLADLATARAMPMQVPDVAWSPELGGSDRMGLGGFQSVIYGATIVEYQVRC